MASSEASLSGLPSELLQHILFHLPPKSLVAVQRTSKRLKHLGDEPLLWRHHCWTHYKYWNSFHDIVQKYAAPVASVDWKTLFASRQRHDVSVRNTLNLMLRKQHDRIRRAGSVAGFGYDAKDELLRHIRTPDSAEDVLARRYYANELLGYIHREMALDVWSQLAADKDVSLEKVLAAFDMFVLDDREGDFDDISRRLDGLATDVLQEHPHFQQLATRQKALTLVSFLVQHGLTGLKDGGSDAMDDSYRDLQNNFIGIALHDSLSGHPSLPIISAAIYSCLADRLGFRARPCGFPFHVYCVVTSPRGQSLDGGGLPPGTLEESMFLDPFRSEYEVPSESLKAGLRNMGVRPPLQDDYLGEISLRELVLRCSRNIRASVEHARQRNHHQGHTSPLWATVKPDIDSAFHASLWAVLIVTDPSQDPLHHPLGRNQREQTLPIIMEHIELNFPLETSLMKKYILPLFAGSRLYPQFDHILNEMLTQDQRPKRRVLRDAEAKYVKYKVGQVFRHRRYNYEGVVTGWDPHCGASDAWIQRMGVDNLRQGRRQSFYHVLVNDKSRRYVAEENIDPTLGEPSDSLKWLGGRFFKRWDSEKKRFVSNVTDEYPDD